MGTALVLATALSQPLPVRAQEQGFNAPRFETNERGNIRTFGNSLLTCNAVAPNCTVAQQGGGLNNNQFNMRFVDVDADPSTFNSSRATVSLPPNAEVLWAGLYWGGDTSNGTNAFAPNGAAAPNPAQRNQVRFSTPANGSSYVTLLASETFEFPATDSSADSDGFRYQGFREVTSLVQAAGEGQYAVANVQAGNGQTVGGLYGGWALVVVFRNPNETLRNLSVFDGLTEIRSLSGGLDITLDGFVTPAAGSFNARVGAVTYEGDRGLIGDDLEINGTPIGDANNPLNNFFNSSINGPGTDLRSPSFANQLGFDITQFNLLNPEDVLGNSSESARLSFTTDNDAYFPGVLTFAIDTFRPLLGATKTVTNLDGGNDDVEPGDRLEYRIRLENLGDDAAANLVLNEQTLPENTTYVPGSLQVLSGVGSGPQSDAVGDDLAEFTAQTNQVRFRLGSGATAQAGGSLQPGEVTEVSFQVRVDPGTAPNTVIRNQAIARFTGASLGEPFIVETDGDVQTPGAQPTVVVVQPTSELSLLKRITAIRRRGIITRFDNVVEETTNANVVGRVRVDESLALEAGDRVEYSIYFQAQGDRPINDFLICDPLPSPLQYVPGSLRLTLPNDNGAILLSDAEDGDAGSFIPALTPVAAPCPNPANPNGAVIVNAGSVSPSLANERLGSVQLEAQILP